MSHVTIANDRLPGTSIYRVVLSALYILKSILIGIPIIWIPILLMLLLESGDGYARALEDTIFLDLYLLPVLKCIVIFPCLGLLLHFMMKTKSIRLSPRFPYPFLLAIALFFTLFCVVTTLPRLQDDPVIFIRIVLLQLYPAIIFFPLFFGKWGILFSVTTYIAVRAAYGYSAGPGQEHWLLSEHRSVNSVFAIFFTAVFYVLIFRTVLYFKGKKSQSLVLIPSKDKFESLPQDTFDRWPLWRQLVWDPFTPMHIFLGVSLYLFYLISMLNWPITTNTYGYTFVFILTMASCRQPASMHLFRAQCRRLFLQSSAQSKKQFFQHFLGFEILRFLPVLPFYLILSAVVTAASGTNYWWICIFSLLGFLLGWLGFIQLELLKAGKKGIFHIAWILVVNLIAIIFHAIFWRDNVLIIGLFILLILLMALLLYLRIQKFCAIDMEF